MFFFKINIIFATEILDFNLIMKKIILSVALVLSGLSFGQDTTYNKSSIDFGVGLAGRLSRTFAPGYGGNRLDPLSFNLGYRRMLSRELGVSVNLGYNNFTAKLGEESFSSSQYAFSLNGILNLRNLLNLNDFSEKFGLFTHAGGGLSINTISKDYAFNGLSRDLSLFVSGGITPQYKYNEKLAFNLDFSLFLQKYQTLTLDMMSIANGGLFNKLYGTATVGVNYYCFGSDKNKMHADWYARIDKSAVEIEALKNKFKSLENKLVDTDKDGVADYLDLEPSTPEGSIVNTKGQKVVDTDGDGIEDSEDYCPTVKGIAQFKGCPTAVGSSNSSVSADEIQGNEVEGQLKYDVQKYTTDINFATKSTSIKLDSKKQLDALAKILSSNSKLIISLHGHCDNIGEDALNNKLSLERANIVKDYLVGKGVESSRIMTKGHGTSKPKQSNETEKGRSANRRVEFEVKSK